MGPKRRIRTVKEAQGVYHNKAKVVVCSNIYELPGHAWVFASCSIWKVALSIKWLAHARRNKGPAVRSRADRNIKILFVGSRE